MGIFLILWIRHDFERMAKNSERKKERASFQLKTFQQGENGQM